MKKIDSKKILYGTHIGEHGYDNDKLTDEIQRLCIDRGMNFVTIRVPRTSEPLDEKYLIEWAKFCAENACKGFQSLYKRDTMYSKEPQYANQGGIR